MINTGGPEGVLSKHGGFRLSEDGKTGLSTNDLFDHANLRKIWVSNFFYKWNDEVAWKWFNLAKSHVINGSTIRYISQKCPATVDGP